MENEDTPVKKKINREIMEKSVKKDIFDEYESADSDIPLRTIVNFEIFEKDTKKMVRLDEVSKHKNLSMRGTLLQPLPAKWRECMVSMLTTTPPETRLSVAEYEPIITACSAPSLDWDALQTGDVVDGYCPQTFRWYEAKIVDVGANHEKFKIHFRRWNSKYDEWVERGSARLVPQGVARILIEQVEKQNSCSVPWYVAQDSNLLAKASEILGLPVPVRQEQKVIIDGIEDMCVDYTYPNPSLWVCVNSGVWYRVAGALCPNGIRGSPSGAYTTLFQPAYETLITTGHVAMAALDMLTPDKYTTSPTFQDVADEVTARSLHNVNEVVVLHHAQFLVDQLEQVQLLQEDTESYIGGSLFYKQLQKEGLAFAQGGGLDALVRGDYKGPAAKRRVMVFEGNWKPPTVGQPTIVLTPAMDGSNPVEDGDDDGAAGREEDDGKKKRRKKPGDYPIDDMSLFEAPHAADPTPLPSSSTPSLLSSVDDAVRGAAQERLLYIYNTLRTFPATVGEAAQSVDSIYALVQCLEDPDAHHALLRATFAPILTHLVFDRVTQIHSAPETVSDAHRRLYRHSTMPYLHSMGRCHSLDALYHSICIGNTYETLLLELYGSTNAADMLRDCNSERALLHCSDVLDRLAQVVDCQSFYTIEEDLSLHYRDGSIVSIGMIRERLENGWYLEWAGPRPACVFPEDVSIVPLHPPTRSHQPVYVGAFSIGEVVDVYSLLLNKWIEAVVIDVSLSPGSAAHGGYASGERVYKVRYLGWGVGGEETIAESEDRMLPESSKATLDKTKRMTPDELFEKNPQLVSLSAVHRDDGDDSDMEPSDMGPEIECETETAAAAQATTQGAGVNGFLRDLAHVYNHCLPDHPHLFTAMSMQHAVCNDPVVRGLYHYHTSADLCLCMQACPGQCVACVEEPASELKCGENEPRQNTEHAPEVGVGEGPGRQFYSVDVYRELLLTAQHRANKLDHGDYSQDMYAQHEDMYQDDRRTVQQVMEGAEELEAGRWSFVCDLWTRCRDLHVLPIAWRVYVLYHLCVDYMECQHVADQSDVLVSSLPSRKSMGRVSLSGLPTEDMDDALPAAAVQKRKKRKFVDDDGVDVTATTPMDALPSATPAGSILAIFAKALRMVPIGEDRFGNTYYLWCPTNQLSPLAVLCECNYVHTYEEGGEPQPRPEYEWRLYSSRSDILALVQWLDMRGMREVYLLQALYLQAQEISTYMEPPASNEDEGYKRKKKHPKDVFKEVRGVVGAVDGLENMVDSLLCCLSPRRANTPALVGGQLGCGNGLSVTYTGVYAYNQSRILPSSGALGPCVYLYARIKVPRDQALGLGVKASVATAQVYVSSFKALDCVAAVAGLRIGDRVLTAHNLHVTSVGDMKTALLAAQGHPSCAHQPSYLFEVLVCRYLPCESDPVFAEMVRKDADTASALSLQQTKAASLESTSIAELGGDAIGDAVHAVVRLVDACTQPFCIASRSVASIMRSTRLLVETHRALRDRDAELNDEQLANRFNTLHLCLALCMQLEEALFELNTVLYPNWTLVYRLAWVSDCHHLLDDARPGVAVLCHIISRLYVGLDWEAMLRYAQCCHISPEDLQGAGAASTPAPVAVPTTTPNKRARASTPSPVQNSGDSSLTQTTTPRQMLDRLERALGVGLRPGCRVLYFTDGHTQAHAMHHRSRASLATCSSILPSYYDRNPLQRSYTSIYASYASSSYPTHRDLYGGPNRAVIWGDSVPAQDGSGGMFVCVVQSIRYFHEAPVPFAQVVLRRVDLSVPVSTASSAPPKAMLSVPRLQSAPRDCLTRHLLSRLLSAIRKANNCKPFMMALPSNLQHLVTQTNSNTQVDYEIALTVMQARLSSGCSYRSVRVLLRELEALVKQTEAECTRDQRRTVALAQEIYSDALALSNVFLPEASRGDDEDTPDVTIATDMPAPSPVSSVPRILAASNTSTSFTVTLRADGQGSPFVVPLDRYQQCVQAMQSAALPCVYTTAISSARRGSGSGSGSGGSGLQGSKLTSHSTAVTFNGCKGVVVGLGPSVSIEGLGSVLGWEALEIDWLEPQDCSLPSRMNPWDLIFSA